MNPGTQVKATPSNRLGITLSLKDYATTFQLRSGEDLNRLRIEHSVLHSVVTRHLPADWNGIIEVTSPIPPGSSLGTSASVGVALTTALRTVAGLACPPRLVAVFAHEAETSAGLQSGVQDHAAAAFGGVSLIDVDYPKFAVRRLTLSDTVLAALEDQLVTVFLGRSHHSSSIHDRVIRRLTSLGSAVDAPELAQLRLAAASAASALRADDLSAYGRALDASVEAQRTLHPDLVDSVAQQLISMSQRHGGSAKVNGAGGDGGSVTLLAPAALGARRLFDADLHRTVESIGGAVTLALKPALRGVTVEKVG
jgi:D-glycero-alpha-D-manno-heptose-7-phosphate kinase